MKCSFTNNIAGNHVLAPVKRGGPYEPGNVVRGEDSLRGTNYSGTAGQSGIDVRLCISQLEFKYIYYIIAGFTI